MKNLTLVIRKRGKRVLPQVLNELKKYKLKKIVVLEKKIFIQNQLEIIIVQFFSRKKGYGAALIQGIKK